MFVLVTEWQVLFYFLLRKCTLMALRSEGNLPDSFRTSVITEQRIRSPFSGRNEVAVEFQCAICIFLWMWIVVEF